MWWFFSLIELLRLTIQIITIFFCQTLFFVYQNFPANAYPSTACVNRSHCRSAATTPSTSRTQRQGRKGTKSGCLGKGPEGGKVKLIRYLVGYRRENERITRSEMRGDEYRDPKPISPSETLYLQKGPGINSGTKQPHSGTSISKTFRMSPERRNSAYFRLQNKR
jgi:hypothetical protein